MFPFGWLSCSLDGKSFLKNDKEEEEVQVETELKTGWDSLMNAPPRLCLPVPGNLGEVYDELFV